MRKLLLLGMMLLSLAGIVQGHDVNLPSCNEAQLKEAVALFPDYYDLIVASAGIEVSAETVVDYSELLFAWRDRLWEQLPLCEEAFHAGELMDATASYLVGTYALELAGAPAYTDMYVESASAAETEQELLDLLSDPPPARDELSEAYSLPICSDTDLDILKTILAEFFALQEIPPKTETAGGLASYAEAQAVWRDSIGSRLPFCQRSFKAGLLMRHIASDAAIELAFEIANRPAIAAAISERIASDRASLAAVTKDFADEARELVSSQSFAIALPACADQEKIGYVLFGLTHPDLFDAIGNAATPDDLLDAARAHLEWREDFDANLPACAENLEIFWIVYRAASAFFTGHTLDLAGLPREDNAHIRLVIRLDARRNAKTSVITHAFADAVIDSIEDEEAEESEAAPMPERSLPACETKKLGMGFFNALVQYSELVERVDAVGDVGDVLDFFDAEIAWTDKYFDALPTCAEALHATLLMYRVLADYSSSFALLVAGVAFDDIPYVDGIYRNESLLNDWLQEFTQ